MDNVFDRIGKCMNPASAKQDYKEAVMATLISTIKNSNFNCSNEKDFQLGVKQILEYHGIPYKKEYYLGTDPIDFYLPGYKIGIECKIKGAEGDVLRQLWRYSEHEHIDELMLVTTKRYQMPQTLFKDKKLVQVWKVQM
jgi:hypothetical protein